MWESRTVMHLSSHWGLEDPSGFQSSLCVCLSESLSLCFYVSLVVRIDFWWIFLWPVIALRTCGHRPWGPQYNRDSILCPSVRPSFFVRGPFWFLYLYSIFLILEIITVAITITSVRVQHRDEFIPTLRSSIPQWGPVKLMCLSVCLSMSLSGILCHLLEVKERGP